MKLSDLVNNQVVAAQTKTAKPNEMTHEDHKAKQELHEKIAATKGIHPDVKNAALHIAKFHEDRNTAAKLAGHKRFLQKKQKEAADEAAHEKMSKELVHAITNMRGNLVPHEQHVAHLKVLSQMLGKAKDNYLSPSQITAIHEHIKKLPKVKAAIKTNHAESMVNSAKNQMKKVGGWDHSDHDMHSKHIYDAANHLKIAHHLNKNEHAKAAKLADTLDTGSRDEIPGKVWEHLARHWG